MPPNPHPPTQPIHKKTIGTATDHCTYCEGSRIIKKGKREKKFETIQLWYCHSCKRNFTLQLAKNKTYPLRVILQGLSHYSTGRTIKDSIQLLKQRYGLNIKPRTLNTWLDEYKPFTTYARLREAGAKLFSPHQLVRSVRLHHKQVYTFRTHRAKLALTLKGREHQQFAPIETFLTNMAEECPHHLFANGPRASKGKETFNLERVEIREKQNLACRIAELVLPTAPRRTLRHDTLQRFMLTNDSVTVAVEVPIYLTPDDIEEMTREYGFQIPWRLDSTLTGHIDFIQIRNGSIHILDYKPNAKKEKPIGQLMSYALALSQRTGLRLYHFTCAWFDEHHYFEFYPLRVVRKTSHERP